MFGASQSGRLQLTCRGAGGIVPAAQAENANTVPRSAVPAPRTNVRHNPLHPRLRTIPLQRGCNRMGGPWENTTQQICMTWPGRARPTIPRGPVFFPYAPGDGRTRPTPKFIYPRSRQRGPIFGQRNNAGRALPEGSARR